MWPCCHYSQTAHRAQECFRAKGTRAESSDRTDKCLLPATTANKHFSYFGHISISQAGISSPGNQTKSLITDHLALLKCHGAPTFIKTYFSESTYITAWKAQILSLKIPSNLKKKSLPTQKNIRKILTTSKEILRLH